jgi:hypothetical protein
VPEVRRVLENGHALQNLLFEAAMHYAQARKRERESVASTNDQTVSVKGRRNPRGGWKVTAREAKKLSVLISGKEHRSTRPTQKSPDVPPVQTGKTGLRDVLIVRIDDTLKCVPVVRTIDIAKRERVVSDEHWEREEGSVRVILTPARPDTDNEGAITGLAYAVSDLIDRLSSQGASVESRLFESQPPSNRPAVEKPSTRSIDVLSGALGDTNHLSQGFRSGGNGMT